jgi:hypothetical protein
MHGNSPSISIPILEASALADAAACPPKGPLDSARAVPSPVDRGTIRCDRSTAQSSRAASVYRQSDSYKKKRSEKRRAKRTKLKEQVRNAAAQVQPASLQIASLPCGGAGYTGSLRRGDSAAAEQLWVDSERMTAMSTLVPVPYKLSPPLLKQGNMLLTTLCHLQIRCRRSHFFSGWGWSTLCHEVFFA